MPDKQFENVEDGLDRIDKRIKLALNWIDRGRIDVAKELLGTARELIDQITNTMEIRSDD